MIRRQFLRLAVGAVAVSTGPRLAQALDYPTRPITIVVPFPAGGPTDTLARLLAAPMRASLGQPLVVENIGGAGGSVGAGRVARATPDGYTIILGNWTSFVGTPAAYPVTFDPLKDFTPVALLSSSPLTLIVRKAFPPDNVRQLIAWLKANPNKATAGTVGVASPSQIGGLYFQKLTGTQFQFVPYRGAAPEQTDMLAGRIDMRFGAEASQILPYLRSGGIKALAVMGRTRWSQMPNIPTIAEAGLAELALSYWSAFWAPSATPPVIVAKLNAAAVAGLADATVRQRLHDFGQEIPPPEQQSPQALGVLHKAEIEKWWPIIRAAGIKAQ